MDNIQRELEALRQDIWRGANDVAAAAAADRRRDEAVAGRLAAVGHMLEEEAPWEWAERLWGLSGPLRVALSLLLLAIAGRHPDRLSHQAMALCAMVLLEPGAAGLAMMAWVDRRRVAAALNPPAEPPAQAEEAELEDAQPGGGWVAWLWRRPTRGGDVEAAL